MFSQSQIKLVINFADSVESVSPQIKAGLSLLF